MADEEPIEDYSLIQDGLLRDLLAQMDRNGEDEVWDEFVYQLFLGYSQAMSYGWMGTMEDSPDPDRIHLPFFDVFESLGWFDSRRFSDCYIECMKQSLSIPDEITPEMSKDLVDALASRLGPTLEKLIATVRANMDRQFLYSLSVRLLFSALEFFLIRTHLRCGRSESYQIDWPNLERGLGESLDVEGFRISKRSRVIIDRIRITRRVFVHNGGVLRDRDVADLESCGVRGEAGESIILNIRTIRLFYRTVLQIGSEISSI